MVGKDGKGRRWQGDACASACRRLRSVSDPTTRLRSQPQRSDHEVGSAASLKTPAGIPARATDPGILQKTGPRPRS